MAKELKAPKLYKIEEDMGVAFMDLQAHIEEFNRKFDTEYSMTNPKRKPLEEPIGKASDNNHRLYQEHMDLILAECPKPITRQGIIQVLVSNGEKPSTARLLASGYLDKITQVLDPKTKLHKMSTESLKMYGHF